MSATGTQRKWNEPDEPIRRTKTANLERWLDSYHLSRLERDRYVADLVPRSKTPRDPDALPVRR